MAIKLLEKYMYSYEKGFNSKGVIIVGGGDSSRAEMKISGWAINDIVHLQLAGSHGDHQRGGHHQGSSGSRLHQEGKEGGIGQNFTNNL